MKSGGLRDIFPFRPARTRQRGQNFIPALCPAIFYSLCYVCGGFVIHSCGSLYFIVIQLFKPIIIAELPKVPTFPAKRFLRFSFWKRFFILLHFPTENHTNIEVPKYTVPFKISGLSKVPAFHAEHIFWNNFNVAK